MKTLKVLLQEVVSGIKAWVNSNFAQESNTVHKTGNETVNGVKTFTGQGVFNTGDSPIKIVNSQDATNPGSTVMKDLRFYDVNDKIIGGVRHSLVPDGTSKIHLYSRSFSSDGNSNSNHGLLVVNNRQTGVHEVQSESSFIPAASNSYNLGTSSYQWNNVYAKNYYYNGIKWGLDQQNEWTNYQRMICNPAVWYLKNNTVSLGTAPSSNRYSGMFFEDVNGDTIGHVCFQANKSGVNSIQFNVGNSDGTTTYASQMRLRLGQDGSSVFIPETNNTIKLGDSGNHWKDCYTYLINGVNPGALSIPAGFDSSADSSFTPDTTDWPKDGTGFQAEMPIVGWLRITIKNVAGNYAFVRRGTAGVNQPWQIFADPTFATDLAEVTLNVPVTNGTYTLKINSPGGFTAKVYPCLGNV